jgi:hypothetical protein
MMRALTVTPWKWALLAVLLGWSTPTTRSGGGSLLWVAAFVWSPQRTTRIATKRSGLAVQPLSMAMADLNNNDQQGKGTMDKDDIKAQLKLYLEKRIELNADEVARQ